MKLVGCGAVVGVVVGAVLALACGPEIVETHRDLAEEYCRDRAEYLSECNGSGRPWSEEMKQDSYDECYSKEAWDWSDHCGDKWWALLSCLDQVPCDRWPAVARNEDNSFCQEEEAAFYISGDCLVTQDHGG